jgi:hypothetical protein
MRTSPPLPETGRAAGTRSARTLPAAERPSASPHPSSAFLAILLAAALLPASCGEGPPADPASVAWDSAGVRIVELPPDNARPPERVLAVDPDWAPASGLEFGELVDIDLMSDGRIVLLDALEARVTILAPDGTVEASFGGPGEGPGEFEPRGLSPLTGLVAMDSTVIVPDLALQRLTEFSLAGEVLRTVPVPRPGGYAVDWRTHPSGGLAFRLSTVRADLILRVTDERVDTLHVFPAVDTPFNTLLAPTPIWDLTPRGDLVVGRSDRPAVELRGPGPDEVRWIARIPDAGGPLSEDARAYLEDLVVETQQELMGGARMGPEARAALLSQISFPARTPVFGQVRAAADGTVWLRRAREPRSMDREALRPGSAHGWGGALWEVLGEDGLLRERARLPDGFRPRRFRDSWIYGILIDDLGLQTVARVGIEP